jgi:hypothetical protein
MKLIGSSMFGLAGLAAYLGLAAVGASAQQAAFTLPVEAHWGHVVLEPGDYKVRFPSSVDTMRLIRVTGNGKTLNFLPQVTSVDRKYGDSGKLVLTHESNGYRVSSISKPDSDSAFAFPLPKSHESSTGSLAHQDQAKIAVQIRETAN